MKVAHTKLLLFSFESINSRHMYVQACTGCAELAQNQGKGLKL